MTYARHDEMVVETSASAGALFDHLDDQSRLAGHMGKPSAMMMGGRMTYELDDGQGRAAGSVIRMGGRLVGLELFVEEVVTEREPPWRKTWETRGRPKLIVIARYRMGFEITARRSDASTLRVFIDYDLPTAPAARLLGALLAPIYARWCVARMARDAERRFSTSPAAVAA